SPNRRPPSPNTDGISPYSPEVTTKKVNVLKARLYLLQQNGPNSFRIGGDSPEHKYLVIIGPQSCNCGRGIFCIHVLFVMLRVFQLEPTSTLLWRKTLKNYEVESLFKSYHERCNSRISPKKKSRVQRLVSHLASGADKHADTSSNSDDQCSSKGEEENCPICLLQMVDGESVTVCEVGCRNKLHTHCVNIWAEECRRNGGPLKCPLCRVVWKPADTSHVAGMGPLMVDIPHEYTELADTWTQAFGWEMVSCLFSSHPNVRENALRRLSHDITGALLTNIQLTDPNDDHTSDDSDSSMRGATGGGSSSLSSNAYLASCCAILAMVCGDPEYRVYITALRTLRAMMAYTQCRNSEDVQAFQRLLAPVIETILFKCADSNRRNVQLSVSTVMELCRGQSGELAVGKEMVSGESLGIGNVVYLLSFLDFGGSPDTSSWQWMLGRLNALGELFREFKSELSIRIYHSTDTSVGIPISVMCGQILSLMHEHNFPAQSLQDGEEGLSPGLSISIYFLLFLLRTILSCLIMLKIKKNDFLCFSHHQVSLFRPIRCVSPGTNDQHTTDLGLSTSPLVNSDNTAELLNSSDTTVQTAIQNCDMTINYQYHDSGFAVADLESEKEVLSPIDGVMTGSKSDPVTPLSSLENPSSKGGEQHPVRPSLLRLKSESSAFREPNTNSSKFASTRHTSDFGASFAPQASRDRSSSRDSSTSSTSCCEDFRRASERRLSVRELADNINRKNNRLAVTNQSKKSDTSPGFKKQALEKSPSAPTTKEDGLKSAPNKMQTTDATLSHTRPLALKAAIERRGTLSSSVEDLLAESDHSQAEKTPVTFKSEIGDVPLEHGNESYEADLAMQCSCRMKIEEEEDKLFAHTLAVSYIQDALPTVPHLSFTEDDVDIVRVQDETTDIQKEYKENKQWCKGAQIGLGAFSACYQARDMFTGTLMAVKQVNHVRCSAVEERQVLAVITEEISLMRRLSHPNIVRLHGITKEGPLYNIFIEWCAGGSVSTLLSHYGAFNEGVIMNYTLQLLRGLSYIHEQYLIHRDIKGANLLIDSTGQRLRISDFGAAARLASKGTGAGEFQGQLLGTIAFMAPEVLRGEQYGRSCDVWGCGCVITEMASGKPPWEADMHSNHLALIFKIASSPTVPPIPDHLSPAMKDLCRRCLQANPRDRPTAQQLLKHPVFIRW
uniref:Mitogen-activated protein kinase kinase kinase 1 n=1 Tax=Ciona savignyi TaxID=51511 RepID=H2YSR3_CIOSA